MRVSNFTPVLVLGHFLAQPGHSFAPQTHGGEGLLLERRWPATQARGAARGGSDSPDFVDKSGRERMLQLEAEKWASLDPAEREAQQKTIMGVEYLKSFQFEVGCRSLPAL